MFWLVISSSVTVLIILLMLRGRVGHSGLASLRGWSYAHRGLHSAGNPENSMAAFKRALDHGYGVELDIHLMKDGNLAVIHDASLLRTAGADVNIENLTAADLETFHLENTNETIPLFEDVLKLFNGKAPLIVEVKSVNNYAALCEAVSKRLDHYDGAFCVESFDPRCIIWFKKNRPHFIRGQLAENYLVDPKSKLPFVLKCVMSWNLGNFLSKPDFIAYKFVDSNNITVKLCRRLWRLQGVAWTLRTIEEYNCAVKNDWLPIFENFEP